MNGHGICKYCGHPIHKTSEGLHVWVHDDGIAVCPNATYASPVLP